jgi:hypothetical protein
VHGPNAANVTALIYEPVLSLRVGAPEVMAGQITHLLAMSQRRNVIMQVVPADGYFPGLDGEFAIVSGTEFPDTVDMLSGAVPGASATAADSPIYPFFPPWRTGYPQERP